MADAVVGNPPFVGDKKMRRELGDAYTEALRAAYTGRVPGGADLVCYWFEKARGQISSGTLQRAGLVSSNMMPSGTLNRAMLERVCGAATIYAAWRDLPWVNNGAAVRVALTAFAGVESEPRYLNGIEVVAIGPDLQATSAVELASDNAPPPPLVENRSAALQGITKGGAFDIQGSVARAWLALPNPHGRPNSDVVRPWRNGEAITKRDPDKWIVDFHGKTAEQAAMYEAPFAHVLREVKPERDNTSEPATRRNYWLFKRSGADMRNRTYNLPRVVGAPETPTHTVFAWIPKGVVADKNLVVIARQDDATFGLLCARPHLVWVRRYGGRFGDHPTARRYNSTRTFDPFPFPAGLTPADTAHQRTETLDNGALIPADLTPDIRAQAETIARAAHRLVTLRNTWLNPPEWTDRVPEVVPLGMTVSPYPDRIVAKPGFEKDVAKRTLTNLYNQRPAWLAQAHATLDMAVAAAYGWDDYSAAMPDEEILRRLLALNLERASHRASR